MTISTETACKVPAEMLQPFETQLHAWHGGMGSSVYSVASMTTARKASDLAAVLDAVNELECSLIACEFQDSKQAAQDAAELTVLIQTLGAAFAPTIDARFRLLPNDQGEHDISVLANLETTKAELAEYARQCQGRVMKRGNKIGLMTAWEGNWVLTYSDDCQQLLKVESVAENGDVAPYWDRTLSREIGTFYQTGNAVM